MQPNSRLWLPTPSEVSVPSTGRSGLQLELVGVERTVNYLVSVPSTGRSGLQRDAVNYVQTRLGKFQYPLRVEVGCNVIGGSQAFAELSFQYPLRVEVGCNLSSIQLSCQLFLFQYPLRVEVGCNSGRGGVGTATRRVSVPSTGRSGLQHVHGTRKNVSNKVSVPSTGRSGLQPSMWRQMATTVTCFSTLYGSKWVATSNSSATCAALTWFQYPLRVEVGCNSVYSATRSQ